MSKFTGQIHFFKQKMEKVSTWCGVCVSSLFLRPQKENYS